MHLTVHSGAGCACQAAVRPPCSKRIWGENVPVKRPSDRLGSTKLGVKLPSGDRACATEMQGAGRFEWGQRAGEWESALVIDRHSNTH
jgi:hypothetical protein